MNEKFVTYHLHYRRQNLLQEREQDRLADIARLQPGQTHQVVGISVSAAVRRPDSGWRSRIFQSLRARMIKPAVNENKAPALEVTVLPCPVCKDRVKSGLA